ncbi:S-type anion channel SLAH2-like [Phragmites australis]|uniref:S-type anion channel SLAH2-like n=1 Tax=Phragmites australis TaxID=29695 RepID=UPI002D7869F8|nr:S-type anion channel SLAH2-like [Phragmites australis]XP_062181435.1 S-type anion channel SLAH2-like [Phragmites australis]XP_062181436.1 S-type anion channel SLAH2-like [Phragmites australis]
MEVANASRHGAVPPLLAEVEVSNLPGFDVTPSPSPQPQDVAPSPRPQPSSKRPSRPGVPPLERVPRRSEVVLPPLDSPFQPPGFRSVQSVSISLPASPSDFGVPTIPVAGASAGDSHDLRRQAMENAAREPQRSPGQDKESNSVRFAQPDKGKMMFRSQPIPGGQPPRSGSRVGRGDGGGRAMNRDKRYDTFKTFSGKLERQLTHLAGAPEGTKEEEGDDAISAHRTASMPKVDRFFAALEGPELDKLKSEEELVLPSDKTWPFLLRFPVSAFGICLGVSSQAILWKTIATSAPTTFLHVTTKVNLVLWCVSVALMCAITAIYALKLVFFFEAVRREYYHPIRVNFFFAPWIACLFLAIGVPPSVATDLPRWLWYALMAPVLILELKIYGQWMSGGQRRLSKVANPSNHLSVVGNFVGALLGASMGLKEGPVFFFSVGVAHYSVLFVTLYQRLPTNETLPKELHPVFFLFVAAPSVASMAWAKITGEFGYGSRVAYFIAIFLYASLAVRINFFRGFRFSLAWWAYTFPMTGAAIASIRYSTEVDNTFTKALCVALSVIAVLTVTALFSTTLVHAFVLRNLFPNDISIAITERKMKPIMELHEGGCGDDDHSSGNSNDIEAGAAASTAAADA